MTCLLLRVKKPALLALELACELFEPEAVVPSLSLAEDETLDVDDVDDDDDDDDDAAERGLDEKSEKLVIAGMSLQYCTKQANIRP